MPASISAEILSEVDDAGPIVATIFVRRACPVIPVRVDIVRRAS